LTSTPALSIVAAMTPSPDDLVRFALVPPTVAPPGDGPGPWLVFLHGIFGSGANWRTFARRIADARPGWGAVLVDLRGHGASLDCPPPHTLDACARDLVALEAAVPGPVRAVVGHSFGGKVALAYAARARPALGDVWVVDSLPGARASRRGSETTTAVFALLEDLRAREPHPTREAFTAAVTAAGHPAPIAQWLAMNLRRDADGLRFKLDLDVIRALLDDYFARDLWPVIETPPGALRVHLVIGGRSSVFDAAERQRAERRAATPDARVSVTVCPTAGHWVHVDDPDGLFAAVSSRLPAAVATGPR
jgi:pimeloyl-ACP methyl ester carboxylesterase